MATAAASAAPPRPRVGTSFHDGLLQGRGHVLHHVVRHTIVGSVKPRLVRRPTIYYSASYDGPRPAPTAPRARGRGHGRRLGPRRGLRARGHGRAQPRRAQAARVHDVHDDPRPPARQGPADTPARGQDRLLPRGPLPRPSTPTCARRPRSPRSSTRSATSRSATSPARWPSSIPSAARRSSASPVTADRTRRAATLGPVPPPARARRRRPRRVRARARGRRRARSTSARGGPPRSTSPACAFTYPASTPPPPSCWRSPRSARSSCVVTVRAAVAPGARPPPARPRAPRHRRRCPAIRRCA